MPGLQQQVAQPDRSGIELGARRVEHELLVDAWIERRLDFPQRQRFRDRGYQPAWNECHEIGARDDMQRLDIAGHHKGNAPLE